MFGGFGFGFVELVCFGDCLCEVLFVVVCGLNCLWVFGIYGY